MYMYISHRRHAGHVTHMSVGHVPHELDSHTGGVGRAANFRCNSAFSWIENSSLLKKN